MLPFANNNNLGPEAGSSIVALDIGGTKIAAALVVYKGSASPSVVLARSVATEAAQGGAAVLNRVVELTTALLRDARAQGYNPLGAGVSTAGRVNANDGSIAYANELLPGWTGRPLGDALRRATALPVAVVNDVQGYALGEARWGVATSAHTALVIACGTGVGGAVIAQGKLLRGKHGFAGEIGHIVSSFAYGIPCVCGATGHLESVASGSGIEQRYAELVGVGSAPAKTGAEISLLANQGDALACHVIINAGLALGEAIAGLTSVLDPEMVVLSGSVTKAGSLWRAAVQQGFERQIPDAQKDLPITYALLGSNAPLIGAAEELCDRENIGLSVIS